MHDGLGSKEEQRLAALHRYDILDTPPEESFDRITRLAQGVMRTPIAMVTLVDRDRQWFKSRVGVDSTGSARDISFCTHAIDNGGPMVVRDARQDSRFHANPFVLGEPGIRFYLGVPLVAPGGHHIGTLCTIDREPRDPEPAQIALLEDLARMVMDELELRQIATRDALTGALTRRAFLLEAEQAVRLGLRYGHPVSCIALDIDHFKSVNDRHGHAVGDAALRAVADACRSVVRAADSFGRMGGEEFAIVLPETDATGAAATAERLRQVIAQTAVPADAGPLRVTSSFGVAGLRDDTPDIAAMLNAADQALYQAKRTGRDRVVIAPR